MDEGSALMMHSPPNSLYLLSSLCVLSRFSRVQLFVNLWTLLCPQDPPGKNTGVGCHGLLQGILLSQGSNPCLKPPALASRFFTTRATWEAHYHFECLVNSTCLLGRDTNTQLQREKFKESANFLVITQGN